MLSRLFRIAQINAFYHLAGDDNHVVVGRLERSTKAIQIVQVG